MATLNGIGRDSAGGATLKVARATDTIAFASEIQADGGIDLTAAGALDVGAGATATSVNIGTGAAITGVTLGGGAAYTGSTLGKAGVEDNFLGNLDIDGNVVIDGFEVDSSYSGEETEYFSFQMTHLEDFKSYTLSIPSGSLACVDGTSRMVFHTGSLSFLSWIS